MRELCGYDGAVPLLELRSQGMMHADGTPCAGVKCAWKDSPDHRAYDGVEACCVWCGKVHDHWKMKRVGPHGATRTLFNETLKADGPPEVRGWVCYVCGISDEHRAEVGEVLLTNALQSWAFTTRARS